MLCSSETPAAATACYDSCQSSTGGTFLCSSGGESYPGSYKCDGYPDCTDGSDEWNCPTFKCRNGSTVPLDAVCDNYSDCSDGSDELGCPTFTCRNGLTIPQDHRCDGNVDCTDGSDELGCPSQLQDILTCN